MKTQGYSQVWQTVSVHFTALNMQMWCLTTLGKGSLVHLSKWNLKLTCISMYKQGQILHTSTS